MRSWTRRHDGGPGWGPQAGRWYILVDHHMVGYVQQLPPPGAAGLHAYRVRPGAPVGDYAGTWKSLSRAADVLATAAADDVPVTDEMVDAALQGQAKFAAKRRIHRDDPEYAHEAMRAALRCAAPLLLASHALAAAPSGVPSLTHEIRAKVEHALSTTETPEAAIRRMVALGVFKAEGWVLDAMEDPSPSESP